MKAVTKRPLACASAAYLAVSFLQFRFNLSTAARAVFASAAAVSFLLFLYFYLFRKRKSAIFLCAVSVGIALSLLISAFSYYAKVGKVNKTAGEHDFTVKVTDVLFESSYSSEYAVKITEVDGAKEDLAVVYKTAAAGAAYGDIIALRGTLSPLSEEDSYRLSNGLCGVLSLGEEGKEALIEAGGDEPFFRRLNSSLCSVVEKYVGKEGGAISAAMTLGERSGLDASVKRDFRELGIYHLLALSGLHLALISGVFRLIFIRFTGKRKLSALQIAFTLFYMLLCGLSASVVRAGVMLIICLIAYLFRREPDRYTTLLFAVVLICIIDPYSIADVGLMLSFAATAGIFFVTGLIKRREDGAPLKKFFRGIGDGLLVSLGAAVFTLPVTAAYYGELPLLSVLATAIASPFVTVIIILTLFILVTSPLPPVASFFGAIQGFICRALTTVANRVACLCDLSVSLNYAFTKYIIIGSALFFIILVFIIKKPKLSALLSLLAAVLSFGVCYTVYWSGMPDISYRLKNSKTNDALVLISDRKASIIDSSAGYYSFLKSAIDETAERNYIDEIEEIIFTHYHASLPNTVRRLCENRYVYNILLPEPQTEEDTALFDEVSLSAPEYVKITKYEPNKEISYRGIKFSLRRFENGKAHIVYSFDVGYKNEKVTYLSSSFITAQRLEYINPENYDIIYIGTHGGKYKELPPLDEVFLSRAEFVSDEAKNDFILLSKE